MRFLIGFGLMILGGVLTAVTGITPFCIILFVGVFLFASLPEEAVFCDYVIANSNVALVRKRYYINFLPFTIISYILTLRKATLKITWKEEYYQSTIPSGEEKPTLSKISRAEYIALRNAQRTFYSTQTLSKEFMEKTYSPEDIGLKRKKARLIAAIVLSVLSILMMAEPGGFSLTLIYGAIFIPMVILWIPEYQDAKILQQAYDRAIGADAQHQ